jgi:hypothetical protein
MGGRISLAEMERGHADTKRRYEKLLEQMREISEPDEPPDELDS